MAWEPLTHGSSLAQGEVLAPTLAAKPFDDNVDAVRLDNGTAFGLVADVWTPDGGRQFRAARKLRCGLVFINNYGASKLLAASLLCVDQKACTSRINSLLSERFAPRCSFA